MRHPLMQTIAKKKKRKKRPRIAKSANAETENNLNSPRLLTIVRHILLPIPLVQLCLTRSHPPPCIRHRYLPLHPPERKQGGG